MPRTSAASRPLLAAARTSSLRPPIRAAAEAAPGRSERLLGRKLAATAQQRAADAAEIGRLAATVDFDALTTTLARARLLPVLGTRLVATAPAAVPDSFRESLEAALAHARRRSALVEQVTLLLATSLAGDGIRSIALKGPHLAERLYGDAGMRSSNDIDLLVGPDDFHRAIAVLERDGYRSEDKAPWNDGLPLFEASLRADDAWRPPVDLHWRLHWYEDGFARDFVRHSRPGRHGMLEPQPLDELAALLLYWCRDGLIGLRHAADVAAWWDRHELDAPATGLEPIMSAYAPLRPALTAAALHAERVAGIPANRLLPGTRPAGTRRLRLAGRCAERADPWSKPRTEAETILVDALLTPRGGRSDFVKRHFVLARCGHRRHLRPAQTAGLRRALRRVYYAARVGGGLLHGTAQIVMRGARARVTR